MRQVLLAIALSFRAGYCLEVATPSQTVHPVPEPSVEIWLTLGRSRYYEGSLRAALEAYEKGVKLDPRSVEAWLNGAVILEETGDLRRALRWYEKAAALKPDAEIFNAAGWAHLRLADLAGATTAFHRAVELRSDHGFALLGLGRTALDSGNPEQALAWLDRAAAAAPNLNLIPYYQGKAHEALKNDDRAIESFRRSVVMDSYFSEGRDLLAKAYLRSRNYREAWDQWSKALDAEPKSRRLRSLLYKVQALLRHAPEQMKRRPPPPPVPLETESAPGQVPVLRVGVGTDPLGKIRARSSASFKVNTDFELVDPKTGKAWLAGQAHEAWHVSVKRAKKKRFLAFMSPAGRPPLEKPGPVSIRPKEPGRSVIWIDESSPAAMAVRGELEIAMHRGHLRLVNSLDLENYTHGVVSREMPIDSPLEALKAQAVLARTYALHLKKHRQTHRKDGYEVCDQQHCQVYAGVRAESPRSRQVVDDTRGRVVTYQGRVASTIYTANCGGHTQSGKEVWGHVPYWIGRSDAPEGRREILDPWELKQWLRAWPKSYCGPSAHVYPSHYRWTRSVSFKDIEEEMARKLKIGRLKSIRPLKRSQAGNVLSLLVQGDRRSVKVVSEIKIRGLLGLGSLRSTLFVMETELGKDGKPQAFMFYGGGWGHGLGLCQSGAMGRAESGQEHDRIIRDYFPGVEISQLSY
ncbi:MAG: SpoIID/LytB domain-containing protein [Elusimicrobia bacterium]|nr:SpoIID/LytB domain-containing protein [Elusimicrobiota bacterium]